MSQDNNQKQKFKNTIKDRSKKGVSNNEQDHEEDDVVIPSRASKRDGIESRQDRAERQDREKHPNR